MTDTPADRPFAEVRARLAAWLAAQEAATSPLERAWLRAGFHLRCIDGLTEPFGVAVGAHPIIPAPLVFLAVPSAYAADPAARAVALRAFVGRMERDGKLDLLAPLWEALIVVMEDPAA